MDALVHYSEKVDNTQCTFCGLQDGKEHRFFQCRGLSDLRVKYGETFSWIRRQKKAVWAFSLCRSVGQPHTLKTRLQVPRPQLSPRVDEVVKHVYTDGSAFFNDQWDCCLSGAAVIEWYENEMHERKRQILPFQDHSSYRAEVFAVLLTLERFWNVNIFSDCGAVVKQFAQLCDEIQRGGPVTHGDHANLWIHIEWHMRKCSHRKVSMFKVKAHVCETDGLSELDKLHAWGNDCADKSAKAAIRTDNAGLFHPFSPDGGDCQGKK